MLPCPLIVRAHSRLPFGAPPPSAPPTPVAPFLTDHRLSPNSHGITSFADHRPLTHLESYRYKNSPGSSNLQACIVQNPVAHLPVFSITCAMPICNSFVLMLFHFHGGCVLRSTFRPPNASTFPTYPLSFHSVAHSFALCKSTTLFFSIVSALFAKNHPGWG